MNIKWCFSTLLFISLCFGAFQEQTYKPNQEIVLEFVDTSVQKNNITSTIKEVKEKLLEIGATNIVIQETEKGTLKIGYYSKINAQNIKNTLLEDKQLPSKKNSEDQRKQTSAYNYKIDIYELNNKVDISNLEDNFIFEIKHFSERFTIDNFSNTSIVSDYKANQLFKAALNASKSNPFTKEYTSHKEPEVRAGPQIFKV